MMPQPVLEASITRTPSPSMAALFDLLRDRAIHPVVVERLPLTAARDVHTRIDAGGLGGKIVLLPWHAA